MKNTFKVFMAVAIVIMMIAATMLAVSAETNDTEPASSESEILTVGALPSDPADGDTASEATGTAAASETAAISRPTAPRETPKTGDNGLAIVALTAVAALGAAVVVAKKHN